MRMGTIGAVLGLAVGGLASAGFAEPSPEAKALDIAKTCFGALPRCDLGMSMATIGSSGSIAETEAFFRKYARACKQSGVEVRQANRLQNRKFRVFVICRDGADVFSNRIDIGYAADLSTPFGAFRLFPQSAVYWAYCDQECSTPERYYQDPIG